MRACFLMMALMGAVACGGTAIVDPGGSGAGGAGGTGGTTTTTTSGSTSSSGGSTSSGPMGCSEGNECPPNSVCIFATGECALTCSTGICESCPAGQICNECATGSCPGCLDCVAACVPVEPGQCDDHDDCGPEELCVFNSQSCEPACDSAGCSDPNLVCAGCVTSSCPCCEDCQDVCLPLP